MNVTLNRRSSCVTLTALLAALVVVIPAGAPAGLVRADDGDTPQTINVRVGPGGTCTGRAFWRRLIPTCSGLDNAHFDIPLSELSLPLKLDINDTSGAVAGQFSGQGHKSYMVKACPDTQRQDISITSGNITSGSATLSPEGEWLIDGQVTMTANYSYFSSYRCGES